MEKCSRVTILQSQNKTFQKGKDDKSTEFYVTVKHQEVPDFLQDLPALLEHLFTQPYLVLLQYPATTTLAERKTQRLKQILQTDITYSDIGVVDIDCLEGHGSTIEEKINDIVDRYFPIEWKLAKKVIKPSSSYYRKGQTKFHVFFQLESPVKFSSWQQYVKDNFQHYDKNVLGNSASLLYTAKPLGKLKHEEFKCFAMDGEKLSVNTDVYAPNPAIVISNIKHLTHTVELKSERITKPRIERHLKKLDMTTDSYSKSFWTYQMMIAEGYNPMKLTSSMDNQLNYRDSKKHYIDTQYKAAIGFTAQRCVDVFYSEPVAIDNYIDLPKLTENKPSETEVYINAIKGVTGIGKTEAMKKFSSGLFLCVSPTKLLVGQNAKEFNCLAVHSGIEGLESQICNDRVSTTVQSLHRLLQRAPIGFDTLFIDEAAQVLMAALTSNEENVGDILQTLKTLLFSCKYIVLADADLTENTIRAYETALGGIKINVRERNKERPCGEES
jgi:hypothetical protein